MASRQIIHLTNIDDLRSAAPAWDDLWWRSDVSLPTTRAELLAQWLERFAPYSDFRAFVVEEDGRWIAALPLLSRRLMGLLPVGTLPTNPWSPCGDLLLDPAADTAAALDEILAAAASAPWQWLWLNDAVMHSSRWRAFVQACDRAAAPRATHERYPVARIEISRDWDFFQKNLSRAHRQATSKAVRRLNDEGHVRFEMLSQLEPQDVHPWLEKVFAVEDLSWKGAAGSSVLHTPGMFEFFLAQAEQLAHWGQLEVAALELEGHVIATLYGFSAKGVYYCAQDRLRSPLCPFQSGPGYVLAYFGTLARRWALAGNRLPRTAYRSHLALASGHVHYRARGGRPSAPHRPRGNARL